MHGQKVPKRLVTFGEVNRKTECLGGLQEIVYKSYLRIKGERTNPFHHKIVKPSQTFLEGKSCGTAGLADRIDWSKAVVGSGSVRALLGGENWPQSH